MKQTNPKTGLAVVDLDSVMEVALLRYRSLVGRIQGYIKDIFEAADVPPLHLTVFVAGRPPPDRLRRVHSFGPMP